MMRTTRRPLLTAALTMTLMVAGAMAAGPVMAETSLLNVSYDPTRELFAEVDRIFPQRWAATSGEVVAVRSSHGGSGAQARSVIDGLEADVVSLGVQSDIDAIAAKTGLVPKDWRALLPNNASPYYSTVLLVVRKGNPKGIHDWADLTKPGIAVITPNPKTSAGARWNYLAAWGFALKASGGSEEAARAFVKALYANVAVLDSGARGSTVSFVQRRQGDVLIAWEDDALLAVNELAKDGLEIVAPSISIRAEPVVAVVRGVAERHGTLKVAEAYVRFLYSPEGQELCAKHYYRPNDPTVAVRWTSRFVAVPMLTVDGDFGGWPAAQAKHFADGGVFDQLYQPGK